MQQYYTYSKIRKYWDYWCSGLNMFKRSDAAAASHDTIAASHDTNDASHDAAVAIVAVIAAATAVACLVII